MELVGSTLVGSRQGVLGVHLELGINAMAMKCRFRRLRSMRVPGEETLPLRSFLQVVAATQVAG